MIRGVGIEALFHGAGGDLNLAAQAHFGGLEIEYVHRSVYEGLDFPADRGQDLCLDLCLEPPFLAACCGAAWMVLSS